MYLYSLILQRPTAAVQAVHGSFSEAKQHEIVVGRGRVLELLRPDDSGRLKTICTTEVFSLIRDLLAFRLSGQSKDYLIVGSDSGKVAVLKFDATLGRFERIH